MDKKVFIKRIIRCAVQVHKYEDMILELHAIQAKLQFNKLPIHSISAAKQEIKSRIKVLRSYINNHVRVLINGKGIPPYQTRKFGLTEVIDDLVFVDHKTIHDSINGISRQELKDGFVLFNMLDMTDPTDIKEIPMILNLNTGEFTHKPLGESATPV